MSEEKNWSAVETEPDAGDLRRGGGPPLRRAGRRAPENISEDGPERLRAWIQTGAGWTLPSPEARLLYSLVRQWQQERDQAIAQGERIAVLSGVLREGLTLASGMPEPTFEEWRNWIARTQRLLSKPIDKE